MKLHVYTDGACKGNPGKGGWAAIALDAEHLHNVLWIVKGRDDATTNNRMELLATIEALDKIKEEYNAGTYVHIHTDSTYVSDGITKWIYNWVRKNWKTSSGDPVKNVDLWKRLYQHQQSFGDRLKWSWVKAHANDHWNNAVDRLASKMCYASDMTQPTKIAKPTHVQPTPVSTSTTTSMLDLFKKSRIIQRKITSYVSSS